MIGGVAFIAQSLGSPTTQAIETQAQQQGVVVGTAAQSSSFVGIPVNATIGTPYAADVANALYYVTHTLGKANAKVGLVYQNDAYGADGLKGYLAAKSAYHFNDVGHVTYNATDTSFTSQALAMKNAGAQYVVLTAIPTAAAGIMGSAAAIGYHPQWILQGPAWSEYLITSTGGATGKATPIAKVMAGAWVLGFAAAWGDTSVPGMAQFMAITHRYAASQVPDGYYMYGYCMAMMETDMLRKAIAAKDLSRAGILTAKEHLGTVDFGGLIPTATYTPANGPAAPGDRHRRRGPNRAGLFQDRRPVHGEPSCKLHDLLRLTCRRCCGAARPRSITGCQDRGRSCRRAPTPTTSPAVVRRQPSPGCLSRQGPPVLRWALYEAWKTHARASAPGHAYYAQVKDRKNGKRIGRSRPKMQQLNRPGVSVELLHVLALGRVPTCRSGSNPCRPCD